MFSWEEMEFSFKKANISDFVCKQFRNEENLVLISFEHEPKYRDDDGKNMERIYNVPSDITFNLFLIVIIIVIRLVLIRFSVILQIYPWLKQSSSQRYYYCTKYSQR